MIVINYIIKFKYYNSDGYMIELNRMKDNTKKQMRDIIAHEIAHVYLGDVDGHSGDGEEKANNLVEKWGFKRAY